MTMFSENRLRRPSRRLSGTGTSGIIKRSDMKDDFAKVAASSVILAVSWLVLYQASKRASTVYFFELDSTTVIFLEEVPAMIIPLALSIVLYFVYLGTKRSADIERDRNVAKEAEKELKATNSEFNSRKVSREVSRRASISAGNEEAEQQQLRIRRLLSDIEEVDIEKTVRSHREKMESDNEELSELFSRNEETEEAPRKRSRFVVESVEEGSKIVCPDDEIEDEDSEESLSPAGRSRTNSKSKVLTTPGSKLSSGNWTSVSQRSSRKSSVSETPTADKGKLVWPCGEEASEKCDIYKKLGDIDLLSYSLSAFSLLPRSENGTKIRIQLDLLDIIAELFAVHLPIWACVACVHVILLETFSQNFSFQFYYHEESMMYTSLGVSLLFGLFHEVNGNWISNDILAFSSIYVVCSRIQAVSYLTAVIFVVGMSIFDLFFIYAVDLLTTITRDNRAPLMIILPRDWKGNKQSLAALDIMVPGIFLNVVLKYSSMYDSLLYTVTFTSVLASLVFTMLFAIWRHKTTPAMVLPAISAIFSSVAFATHVDDLWKFRIRH